MFGCLCVCSSTVWLCLSSPAVKLLFFTDKHCLNAGEIPNRTQPGNVMVSAGDLISQNWPEIQLLLSFYSQNHPRRGLLPCSVNQSCVNYFDRQPLLFPSVFLGLAELLRWGETQSHQTWYNCHIPQWCKSAGICCGLLWIPHKFMVWVY